jgi:hypothetical protein
MTKLTCRLLYRREKLGAAGNNTTAIHRAKSTRYPKKDASNVENRDGGRIACGRCRGPTGKRDQAARRR